MPSLLRFVTLLLFAGSCASGLIDLKLGPASSSVALGQATATVSDATTPVARPDEWWQARHKTMNNRADIDSYDVLFIGDSITQGWERSGLDVWEAVYRDRNALNLGIGGDRTQHVLWRLENGNLKNQKPKLAIVMIGTNNAAGGDSSEEIAAGVEDIVEKLRKELPETKILLLAIFPRGENNENPLRKVNQKTNEIISKLADEKNVFYLDIGEEFLKEDGTLTKEIMPDLLHLSPKGYQIWAEATEPTVAKLLGESPKEVAALVEARTKLPATLKGVPRDGRWGERHLSFNRRARQGDSDLVLIGDSITQGWEGAGKEVWAKHYTPRKAVNLGIGGDRTQHVLWRLDDNNLKGLDPKLAVLMIGTNNSGDDSSQDIAAGVKAIVEKLRTQRPEMKVLVLGIFPRGATPEDARRKVNEKANEIISKLDDGENVFYLDIGPEFLEEDGTLTKEIMPDLLHLSPKGYQIWANAIEPKVSELLGEK